MFAPVFRYLIESIRTCATMVDVSSGVLSLALVLMAVTVVTLAMLGNRSHR